MLTTILILIAALLVIVALMASRQPNSFRVERRATVHASPDRIFPLINDFHNWDKWSPWEKLDPAMRKTFDGPTSGTGSSYAWAGNSKAGEGRMEIIESEPSSRIKLDLDFVKPFRSKNVTEFDLSPKGNDTEIAWSMYGPSTFMTKMMTLFASMDRMVGKDFEEGLSNLKRVVEQS